MLLHDVAEELIKKIRMNPKNEFSDYLRIGPKSEIKVNIVEDKASFIKSPYVVKEYPVFKAVKVTRTDTLKLDYVICITGSECDYSFAKGQVKGLESSLTKSLQKFSLIRMLYFYILKKINPKASGDDVDFNQIALMETQSIFYKLDRDQKRDENFMKHLLLDEEMLNTDIAHELGEQNWKVYKEDIDSMVEKAKAVDAANKRDTQTAYPKTDSGINLTSPDEISLLYNELVKNFKKVTE